MAFPFVCASPPTAAVFPNLVYGPVVQVRLPPENLTIRHFGPHLAVLDADEQLHVSALWL